MLLFSPTTSSSSAAPSDSLEVRPLITFFGPLDPLELRLKDPSGEGQLSTVNDPLEDASWVRPARGRLRVVAWDSGCAPTREVSWGQPARRFGLARGSRAMGR